MNPIKFIDKIKEMYNDHEPRYAKAEFSPVFDPDLEQSEFLRPGETLEDWEPNPFLKPHAEGGRIGYDDGQLVRPTVDGSRAGYQGKKPYLDQNKFIEEFTTQRIKGDMTGSKFVEYLNENYSPSTQTDAFNIDNVDRRLRKLQKKNLISKDIVTKGSIADRALTPEKYISVIGEEEYARLKDSPKKLKWRYEYLRDIKNRPNFLEIRRKRSKEWRASLSDIEYEELLEKARKRSQQIRGTEAKFAVNRNNAKSMAWRDLVNRTYEAKGDPYFTFEKSIEKGKKYNTADMKDIVLKDKKGNRFTFDTLFDDIQKVADKDEFKSFKNTYDQRAFLNKEGITTELNKLYGNKPGSMKSVFHVQHIEGFNKAPFKVHLTFADQNLNEAYSRRTFTTDFGKATTYSQKKAAINNYYKSLGPDIVAQIGRKPKGEAKTLINLLDKTGIKLTETQRAGAEKLNTFKTYFQNSRNKTAAEAQAKLFQKLGIENPCSNLVAGGGRIGFANKVCGLELARRKPGLFLELAGDEKYRKIIQAMDPNKFKSAARGIVKNIRKLGIANPLSWIGGEVWYVGLDTWASSAKGIPFGEALDKAFIFKDYGTTHSNLMEVAEEMGYSDLQLENLQQTLDLSANQQDIERREYNLPGFQKESEDWEKLKGTDLYTDLSGAQGKMAFDQFKNAEKQLALANKKQDNLWTNYMSNISEQTGKDVSQITDEDINIGFTSAYKVAEDKRRKELIASGKEDYEDKARYVHPYSSGFGEAFYNIWPGNWKQKMILDYSSPEKVEEINKKRNYLTWEQLQDPNVPLPKEAMSDLYGRSKDLGYLFGGASGGRAGYMGGGIAGIRKPHAIPPEKQGLRSIMIGDMDD